MVCNLFYIFSPKISLFLHSRNLLLLSSPLFSPKELHISKCLKNFCSFKFFLFVLHKRKRFIRIYLLFKYFFLNFGDPSAILFHEKKKNIKKQKRRERLMKVERMRMQRLKNSLIGLREIFQANKILCNL